MKEQPFLHSESQYKTAGISHLHVISVEDHLVSSFHWIFSIGFPESGPSVIVTIMKDAPWWPQSRASEPCLAPHELSLWSLSEGGVGGPEVGFPPG